MSICKPTPSTLRLLLRITPNARHTSISAPSSFERAEAVALRVAAPPRDGEANEEVIRFISKALSCSKGSIQIVKGLKGKDKVVQIEGVHKEVEEVRKLLEGLVDR
ncbi:YggU-like protein [Atractiella rhizophila]|nr:YggU-like protein [Atractiella rhizophila]